MPRLLEKTLLQSEMTQPPAYLPLTRLAYVPEWSRHHPYPQRNPVQPWVLIHRHRYVILFRSRHVLWMIVIPHFQSRHGILGLV